MFDWLRKIFDVKFKSVGIPTNPYAPTTQEDPRTIQKVQRTRQAFKKQEASLNMRALKAHSADCNDSWTCTKDKCFKVEPDKIVMTAPATSKEIERFKKTRKRNRSIIKDINNNKKQTT